MASVLNNLGRVFYEEGDLAKARAAHEQALAIKEAAPGFGPDHPSVGATLSALAACCSRSTIFEARITLERALKIQETALGEEHPDLVATLEVLGKVRDASAILKAPGPRESAPKPYPRLSSLRRGVYVCTSTSGM